MTLKTVFAGSRTDIFGEKVPDGRSDEPRSCPWYDVVCAIRRAESALWWAAADWCHGFADIRRTLVHVDQKHQQCDLERDVGRNRKPMCLLKCWSDMVMWCKAHHQPGSCILHSLQWGDCWSQKTEQDKVSVVSFQEERRHELLHHTDRWVLMPPIYSKAWSVWHAIDRCLSCELGYVHVHRSCAVNKMLFSRVICHVQSTSCIVTGAQWCVDVQNATDFSVKQFCVVVCVCDRGVVQSRRENITAERCNINLAQRPVAVRGSDWRCWRDARMARDEMMVGKADRLYSHVRDELTVWLVVEWQHEVQNVVASETDVLT